MGRLHLPTSMAWGLGNWTKNEETLILFPPLSPFGQITALFCASASLLTSKENVGV